MGPAGVSKESEREGKKREKRRTKAEERRQGNARTVSVVQRHQREVLVSLENPVDMPQPRELGQERPRHAAQWREEIPPQQDAGREQDELRRQGGPARERFHHGRQRGARERHHGGDGTGTKFGSGGPL